MLKRIKLLLKIEYLLKHVNMKNWKTTVAGLAIAIGTYLMDSPTPILHLAGQLLVAGGGLFLGTQAKDKNVTGGTIAQTGEAVQRLEKANS